MKHRKLLALGMATLMAMSSTVMVFAEDSTEDGVSDSVTGGGSLEGYIDLDVFTVTLPTTTSVDFVLDPQELLFRSGSSATLDGSALATGYASKILFKDSSNYKTSSADITVVNKSTCSVDVKVDAKLTGLKKEGTDGYEIAVMDPTADNFSFGKTTAITMALTPTTATLTDTTEAKAAAGTPVYLTNSENGVSAKVTVAAAAGINDAYKVSGTTGNYTVALDADAVKTKALNEVVFNLSGTVNTSADWTNFSKDSSANLQVEVTYTVSKTPAPVVDGDKITAALNDTSLSYKVEFPESATAIKAVTIKNNGKSYTLSGTITGNSVTLTDATTVAFLKAAGSYTMYVTFEGTSVYYTLTLVVS